MFQIHKFSNSQINKSLKFLSSSPDTKIYSMKNIDFKQFFQKNWIHFLAVGLFFLVTYIYFKPQFNGYMLKQHDIEQFQGMARETKVFREKFGEEPLWTNSMFGGMPTYQISTKYDGNLMIKIYQFMKLGLLSPAGMFFLYLICFYIAAACMRIKPVIGLFGSFAFAFSSYMIIILQAGHNTKAAAIALAVPVVGAFYMAFRNNMKWGILLSALFMGMEVAANHLQITYYLIILLVGMGIAELIRAIKQSNMKKFLFTSAGLIIAYIFAAGVNYGNISLTNEYAKHTIRGGNDLSINSDGTPNDEDKTGGLSKEYILQWSNGIGESMTLISPYVKGGGSARIKDGPFAEKLRSQEYRKEAKIIGENNMYWGDQIFVSGPVYLGIILVFLAFLSLVYARGPLRWGMFGAAVLCLMLAWGSNFMWLTDLFLDYVPGYDKFRAVTIILSIIGIIVPLMAVFFVHQLVKERDTIAANMKPFLIASGSFVIVLLMLTFTGLGDGYMSEQESEYISNYEETVRNQILAEDPQMLLNQYGIDVADERQLSEVINRQSVDVNKQFDALSSFREDVYKESMWRSILFTLLAAGLIFVFLKVEMRYEIIVATLTVFAVVDLVLVDKNYLNQEKKGSKYEHWMEEEKYHLPHYPNKADLAILETEARNRPALLEELNAIDKLKTASLRSAGYSEKEKLTMKFDALNLASNYRVYEPQGLTSSSRASFFHKSIGGYHGAKLRRIQNLFDFHFGNGNMAVLNMLNVKYIIQGDQLQTNPSALGNVWFVKELEVRETPDHEIMALGSEFEITAFGDDYALVRGEEKFEKLNVFGNELGTMKIADSTLNLKFSQIARSGVSSSFVQDINGNTNWIPLAELKKDTLDSFKELIRVELVRAFNPKDVAIVSPEYAEKIGDLTFSGEGSVALTDYLPNKLTYNVSIPSGNQFAVLSEIYYPDGWKAFVGEKEIPIHRVNYLLRGMELESGEYELTLRFAPEKYSFANTVALIFSLIIVLAIIFFFVKDFILNNKVIEENE